MGIRGLKALTACRLLLQIAFSPRDRSEAQHRFIEEVVKHIYPKYIFGERARIWMDDSDFMACHRSFEPRDTRSADRKYLLRSLLGLVSMVPGDTAECGVYKGASSYLICRAIEGTGKSHHLFDSFSGLPQPGPTDGTYWSRGDLFMPEEVARRRLSPFRFAVFHIGWIPSMFSDVDHNILSFVHIDVDLYEPTLASLSFFYPRMSNGGIVLFDDYGFSTCPGAKLAVDQFMEDKPERIVHCPTGQAFVIRQRPDQCAESPPAG